MKILLLRSVECPGSAEEKTEYLQRFNTVYVERVLGNLRNDRNFCGACGDDCVFCRDRYRSVPAKGMIEILDFPAVLPYLLENPGEYIPREIPPHDILISVCVHEQILIEILKQCSSLGTGGVIVPLEAPHWISPSAAKMAQHICSESGIEISFPKPFCVFAPPAGSILSEFRYRFRVGRPDVELELEQDRIVSACVRSGAACGATDYIARWLVGRKISDNLKYDVISRRLHSYPCTASMEWDREINETILHQSGEAHYDILSQLGIESAKEENYMVVGPLGRMIQQPAAAQENLENVKKAREVILERLRQKETICVAELRADGRLAAAAVNSALLALKQEGEIFIEGGRIRRN